MRRVKEPVSINGIEFDALISSEESYSASAPTYPTEEGFSVSDTLILDPLELSMTVFVSNTPVTWKRHRSSGRVDSVVNELKELFESKQMVTIETSERTYENMVITSMTISKTLDTGYDREIPMSFTQVVVTSTDRVSVPSSYAKSGPTMASTGTASKKVETAESSKSNKSMLLNLADMAGLSY